MDTNPYKLDGANAPDGVTMRSTLRALRYCTKKVMAKYVGAEVQKLGYNVVLVRGSWTQMIALELSLHVHSADDLSCLLYTSPSPRDRTRSRMPSSA